MAQFRVCLVVDEAGDYAVGADAEGAWEAYADSIGGTEGRRLVVLEVEVPLPEPLRAAVTVRGGEERVTVEMV